MFRRVVGILAAVVLLAACDSTTPQNALGSRKISVSDRVAAPAMRGDYMDASGSFDLAQRKGNVVVINFWASYCAPCRTEAPELEKVYAATRADGVAFVGINVHDQRDPAKAFLADVKPTYGSIFDPSASLALDFEVPPNSIPATLVIDRKGRIAAVLRSQIDQKLLEPIVRDLVAEQA